MQTPDLRRARRDLIEEAESVVPKAARLDKGSARAALEGNARLARSEAHALEREALALVKVDAEFKALFRLLQTAPVAGPIVAMTLIAELPELRVLTGKEAMRLTGLAPFIRKSGKWEGCANIAGRRSVPRNVLYMAGMAAKQCDPTFKSLLRPTRGQGKAEEGRPSSPSRASSPTLSTQWYEAEQNGIQTKSHVRHNTVAHPSPLRGDTFSKKGEGVFPHLPRRTMRCVIACDSEY